MTLGMTYFNYICWMSYGILCLLQLFVLYKIIAYNWPLKPRRWMIFTKSWKYLTSLIQIILSILIQIFFIHVLCHDTKINSIWHVDLTHLLSPGLQCKLTILNEFLHITFVNMCVSHLLVDSCQASCSLFAFYLCFCIDEELFNFLKCKIILSLLIVYFTLKKHDFNIDRRD